MMLRGIRIDLKARDEAVARLEADRDRIQWILNKFTMALAGCHLNPNSPKQLKNFFYERLGLPKQYKFEKGQRKVTTNRDALEQLENYFMAEPIVRCILKKRDLVKLISVMRTAVDTDDRMRTYYNVGGTDTGRWSSSRSSLGTGTNLQNITEALRYVFIADPGMKLGVIDLAQAESRVTGLLCWMLFGDRSYLDACESGDLHSAVAEMIWPGVDPHKLFYRHWSYRDMAKRGGHGTNYIGQPYTMGKNLNVPEHVMREFQAKYFRAFPGIKKWHVWVAKQLATTSSLVTPLDRERTFFGRSWDEATIRKAVAHIPQSMVGDILNMGLLAVWRANIPGVQLLAQIHDAVMFQYPEQDEQRVIIEVQNRIDIHFNLKNPYKKQDELHPFFIPSDVMVGWNWGKASKDNFDGLITYAHDKSDTRVRRHIATEDARRLMVG